VRESSFQTGLDALLTRHAGWLREKRVGLVAHAASVNAAGRHAAELLAERANLSALFGPEHGFSGAGGAGEKIAAVRHPALGVPVHSLYGATRKPSAGMLRDLDVLVYDLQDIGVRCYTFVSTLRLVLEAAARHGKTVIVADRPIPLPATVDGPMLEERRSSFVGCVPSPLVYGMTPGEAARWLRSELRLDLDLRVAPMRGYRRAPARARGWPPWISPSPGIRYWETAWTYPALVGFEALPAFDFGRGTLEPFQTLSAPFLRARELAARLNVLRLPGILFEAGGWRNPGVRLVVSDPRAFLPVTAAVAVLSTLQDMHGMKAVWDHPGTRASFFDKLMGTAAVRTRLKRGDAWQDIVRAWPGERRLFERRRRAALLYA
jgi:uncharacterized protein YbbC (DUF1343 family)